VFSQAERNTKSSSAYSRHPKPPESWPARRIDAGHGGYQGKYPDEESFHAGLEAGGLDENLLRLALARQCKVNTIIDKFDSSFSVEIDDVDIGIYYHANFHTFQQPDGATLTTF